MNDDDHEEREVFIYTIGGSTFCDDIDFSDGDTPETNPRAFALVFGAVAAKMEADMAILRAKQKAAQQPNR